MDNKYRMADEFELPLYPHSVHKMVFDNQYEAAAHAINNHDAMQDRIAALEQERDQMNAQNAEFRDALQLTYNNVSYVFVRDLLEKSPATCLAGIQVKTIEDLITEFNANYYGEDLCQWLEQQAEKLRPKAEIDPAN